MCIYYTLYICAIYTYGILSCSAHRPSAGHGFYNYANMFMYIYMVCIRVYIHMWIHLARKPKWNVLGFAARGLQQHACLVLDNLIMLKCKSEYSTCKYIYIYIYIYIHIFVIYSVISLSLLLLLLLLSLSIYIYTPADRQTHPQSALTGNDMT